MAFPPPKKKKPGDFALLMGAPKKPLDEGSPDEEAAEDPEEEASEDDPLMDDGSGMDDPMGDDSIDPEQAALAHRLGFSDPDQQQALIDLIKMVATPDPLKSSDSGSSLPPLPESTY